jgi:hypothetical protein
MLASVLAHEMDEDWAHAWEILLVREWVHGLVQKRVLQRELGKGLSMGLE